MNSVLLSRVARNVRHFRKAAHLSQGALATMAGLSINTVRKLEAEENTVQLDTVEKLAEALGVSADEILQGDVPSPEDLKASWAAFESTGVSVTIQEKRELLSSPSLFRWGAPSVETWYAALQFLRSVKGAQR